MSFTPPINDGSNAELGTDTTVTSTTYVDVASVTITVRRKQNVILFVNGVISASSNPCVAHLRIQNTTDATTVYEGTPQDLINHHGNPEQPSLIAIALMNAGDTKTFKCQAKVNTGHSVTFKDESSFGYVATLD